MEHEDHKLLAFRRGRLVFLVNLHPTNSYTDLAIPCSPGRYDLVLDSDSGEFGGHARLEPGQQFFTQPVGDGHKLSVYLPSRTALVLRLT
jgi:1,4-alpha-glucan branching enzyme